MNDTETRLTNLFSVAKEKILEILSDNNKSMNGVVFDAERAAKLIYDDFPEAISEEDMKWFCSRFAVAISGNQIKYRSIGNGVYAREDIQNININGYHVQSEEERAKSYGRKAEELRLNGMRINTDKNAIPGQTAIDTSTGKLIQELTVEELVELIRKESV